MTEDEPGICVWQIEFPKTALPWIIDSIDNGFWKKPSEGGFNSDVLHIESIIDGHNLLLRFSPNCGSYQWPGIKLENYSVPWGDRHYSSMDMPNNLLREHGLLQGFKDIAATL